MSGVTGYGLNLTDLTSGDYQYSTQFGISTDGCPVGVSSSMPAPPKSFCQRLRYFHPSQELRCLNSRQVQLHGPQHRYSLPQLQLHYPAHQAHQHAIFPRLQLRHQRRCQRCSHRHWQCRTSRPGWCWSHRCCRCLGSHAIRRYSSYFSGVSLKWMFISFYIYHDCISPVVSLQKG